MMLLLRERRILLMPRDDDMRAVRAALYDIDAHHARDCRR